MASGPPDGCGGGACAGAQTAGNAAVEDTLRNSAADAGDAELAARLAAVQAEIAGVPAAAADRAAASGRYANAAEDADAAECIAAAQDEIAALRAEAAERVAAEDAKRHAQEVAEAARPQLTMEETLLVGKWNPNGTFDIVKDAATENLVMVGIDEDLDEFKGTLVPTGDGWWEGTMYDVMGDGLGMVRVRHSKDGVVVFSRKGLEEDVDEGEEAPEWDDSVPAYKDGKFRRRRDSTAGMVQTCTKKAPGD